MNAKGKTYQITLQFVGRESDRVEFSTELNRIEGVKSLVYADPSPVEEKIYSFAYSLDYVVNSIVMIIATAGSIATIANFIHSVLKEKRNKRGRSGKINRILVKTDAKKVEITGEFSAKNIIGVLKATAEMTNSQKALDWLRRRRIELAKREIEQRLKKLDELLPEYRALLELYEKDDKLEPWQEEDYARYKQNMKSLEDEVQSLRKKLTELQSELIS